MCSALRYSARMLPSAQPESTRKQRCTRPHSPPDRPRRQKRARRPRVLRAARRRPTAQRVASRAARPALGTDRRGRPPVVCDTGRSASKRARRDKPSRRHPRAHRLERGARRLDGVRQRASAPLPAHVRCKRHTTAVWAPAGISPPLRRALALRLPEALAPEPRRRRAAVEIQVTLHEDGVLVELLALKQRMDRDLPCPGFRRLESYVVAQAAQIKEGDVVLDPFCGKATFLAEAELCWPGASVIGVDSDQAQLDAAAKNLGRGSATPSCAVWKSLAALNHRDGDDARWRGAAPWRTMDVDAVAELPALRPAVRVRLRSCLTRTRRRHWPGSYGPMP